MQIPSTKKGRTTKAVETSSAQRDHVTNAVRVDGHEREVAVRAFAGVRGARFPLGEANGAASSFSVAFRF